MFIFVFLVHKPLTIGIIKDYYDQKIRYLYSINNNKIIVLAGSNGRFSHRCETIESETGVPCSNMSVAADIGLEYQLNIVKKYLISGDILYLPLEYGTLAKTAQEAMSGKEIPYVVSYDRNYLFSMDLNHLTHALFYFDFQYLLSGIGEMLLDGAGIKRRFSIDTITIQGDESTHTTLKGKQYQSYLKNYQWSPPSYQDFDENSHTAKILSSFMKWAKQNKIKVIGGLPTTFATKIIPKKLIDKLKNYYEKHGHHFLLLDNRSQYSIDKFYDTPYHLCEEYQIEHSISVSRNLQKNEFYKYDVR
jgi:hypothetical protein